MCTHHIRMTLNIPIPDWANWLAQDRDGTWWVYRDRPVISKYAPVWGIPEDGMKKIKKIATEEPNPSWRKTLYRIHREK